MSWVLIGVIGLASSVALILPACYVLEFAAKKGWVKEADIDPQELVAQFEDHSDEYSQPATELEPMPEPELRTAAGHK